MISSKSFEDKKIISINELKQLGMSYYHINKLVIEGILIKLNKFYYENTLYQGEESDFIYAYAYAPSGVICMLSAARYYNLTTFRLDCIDVAIYKKKKIVTLPDWPELKLWYFSESKLALGVSKIVVCNQEIKIFNIEKTIIDILYYREKIGIDEMKEILINYLKIPNRDINTLYRYAKALKCDKILTTYLEVLL